MHFLSQHEVKKTEQIEKVYFIFCAYFYFQYHRWSAIISTLFYFQYHYIFSFYFPSIFLLWYNLTILCWKDRHLNQRTYVLLFHMRVPHRLWDAVLLACCLINRLSSFLHCRMRFIILFLHHILLSLACVWLYLFSPSRNSKQWQTFS